MFSSFEGADRRKEEERVRAEGRLPPGQALTLKFPVLHYGTRSTLQSCYLGFSSVGPGGGRKTMDMG